MWKSPDDTGLSRTDQNLSSLSTIFAASRTRRFHSFSNTGQQLSQSGQAGTDPASSYCEKLNSFMRKSGRSKKGGAGTSACLRKLRGRSTTLLHQRPVIDGPLV